VLARLHQRWSALEDELGWPPGPATTLRDALIAAYGEPHRRYHTVEHLDAVLTTLDELTRPRPPTAASRLATWFHDAVYDPARFDNEERSAAMAEAELAELGTDGRLVAEVAALVLATKGHDVAGDEPAGTDHHEMLDADMAILGSPPAAYVRYADAIRAEYGHLPDEVFRPGRAAVLRGFLARPTLFLTAAALERFEASARHNLAEELARLDESRPLS
jgi:predicted metal-dependent HD superfamily phosphohydrolase